MRYLHSTLVIGALVVTACGKTTSTPSASGPYDTCKAASDCAWGEIDKEILSSSDCMCLLGCPHYALSVETVNRRNAQHTKLCSPHKDGNGRSCPVDDCAPPPKLACVAGRCVAADGGT